MDFTLQRIIFLAGLGVVLMASIGGAMWMSTKVAAVKERNKPAAELVAEELARMGSYEGQLRCADAANPDQACRQQMIQLGRGARSATQSWPAISKFTGVRAAYAARWERFADVTELQLTAPNDTARISQATIEWTKSEIPLADAKLAAGMMNQDEHDQLVASVQEQLATMQQEAGSVQQPAVSGF